MKVFNYINIQIREFAIEENRGKTKGLGYAIREDLDDEDEVELEKEWTVLGETLFMKTVNGVDFTLDIYFREQIEN